MRAFGYASPRSIDEALSLAGDGRAAATRPLTGTHFLAGGTDVLTLIKADVAAPEHLVSLMRVDDLPEGIDERAEGLVIGARTRLSAVEQSGPVQQRYAALSDAAAVAATAQIRNMATMAGNLLQRPRCWYFRDHLFHCWLKGGETCQAQHGENQFHSLFGASESQPCVAVHPSDLASAVVALDASVQLRSSRGERRLTMAEFFQLPEPGRRTETAVGSDELLVSITVPAPPPGSRSTYLKAMDRKAWAFALVGVAAAVRVHDGRIDHARIVLSGVAPIPWRVSEAEQVLLGAAPSDALVARAAEVALRGAMPMAKNGYKVPLATGLVRQALMSLVNERP